MKEWTIQGLDFSVDDFRMECAYDLLTAVAYKSGQYVYCLIYLSSRPAHPKHSVKVHLLRLSNGKPHPRAKNPLLEYEIPLTPTERGWELGVVIWENKLSCLFTSALQKELVDTLVVWDRTSGNIVRVSTPSPLIFTFFAGAPTVWQSCLHISERQYDRSWPRHGER